MKWTLYHLLNWAIPLTELDSLPFTELDSLPLTELYSLPHTELDSLPLTELDSTTHVRPARGLAEHRPSLGQHDSCRAVSVIQLAGEVGPLVVEGQTPGPSLALLGTPEHPFRAERCEGVSVQSATRLDLRGQVDGELGCC